MWYRCIEYKNLQTRRIGKIMTVNSNTAAKRTIITKGALFLVWLTIAIFTSNAWAGTYSGGSGTEGDPYRIATAEDMQSIGANEGDWDKHFLLTADIDLSAYTGTQFNIIGCYLRIAFQGVFDGNNHLISNFSYSIDQDNTSAVGLFRNAGRNAVIKDLTLIDPNVSLAGEYSWEVGSLVGELHGTITRCAVEGGNVLGEGQTGGLVGFNELGTISNCHVEGNVSGGNCTGGLAGYNYGGTISNCYATGSVSGDMFTGGLVGVNQENAVIRKCYSTSDISGGDCTGGLVGYNCRNGTISSCCATGSTSGGAWTGGLVGVVMKFSTVSNCYATGRVSGHDDLGGLAGYNWDSRISNCYATGSVSGHNDLGGLVGVNNKSTVSDSFWDINSSGMDISDGGEGKTTPQMQMQSTFTDAGWDFDTAVWKICEAVDYPRLEWEMIDWPIIDEEPEVTTGTSNTISWQQVNEAIEYYAICCSDDNLENVVAESGWVDVNEWTFDGLSTGQTYWYAVKARQNCVLESDWSDVVSSLQGTLGDAVDVMLDAGSLKNSNMKNALMNKIEQVLEMIDAGMYEDALKKLENDILKKTDGCIKTGQADKNDWITTCEAQQQIYPFVIETIDYVNSLSQ